MASQRTEMYALRRLIGQVELILLDEEFPKSTTARCRELLDAAQGIVGNLIAQDKLPTAAVLGHKGGSQTAKRGSEYFRQLAAKRKTLGGGRPKKQAE
jgi:hypothetical protein